MLARAVPFFIGAAFDLPITFFLFLQHVFIRNIPNFFWFFMASKFIRYTVITQAAGAFNSSASVANRTKKIAFVTHNHVVTLAT